MDRTNNVEKFLCLLIGYFIKQVVAVVIRHLLHHIGSFLGADGFEEKHFPLDRDVDLLHDPGRLLCR